MNNYSKFKEQIKELVSNWKSIIEPGINEQKQYGEENTKDNLIDPVLNALNWKDDGSKNIVDKEFSIKHKTGSGSADYALKHNGTPKILLEAKDVAKIKDLENGYDIVHGIKRTYPRQLSNYCHDLNKQGFDIKYSILTNGKEWIVYNTQYADVSTDREIIARFNIEDFLKDDVLKKLWALEREDICGDALRIREIIQQLHDFRKGIDTKAVQKLLECKDLLSNSLFEDYEKDNRDIKKQIDDILEDGEEFIDLPNFKDFPEDIKLSFFIKEASSSIINKILFIRILEDRYFLTPKLTKRSIERWRDFWGHNDYAEIMNLFRESCRVTEKTYNGGLFKLNPYDKIEYDPDIIKKIIDILGDINFREIDTDIIGRIYEIYLGHILNVESQSSNQKRIKYQPDNKERKKLGQYYTPKFVVDYIVKKTVGDYIKGKNPEEVEKITVLDPSCGSGSFLINIYDYLTEYYEDWNNKILKKIHDKAKDKGAKITDFTESESVPNYKSIILKDIIHGVDLNDLSVQICEINLWLKALERDKKLIKLNKNILHGNSLVSSVEMVDSLGDYKKEIEDIKKRTNQIKEYYEKEDLKPRDERRLEALEKNLKYNKGKINNRLNVNLKKYYNEHLGTVYPFNWEIEFPQVLEDGGFTFIIGNPPYVAWSKITDRELFEEKEFLGFKYSCRPNHGDAQPNLYLFFLIRSLLLENKGIVSFIIPQEWLFHNYAQDFRDFFLDNCGEIRLLQFNPEFKVFKNPTETVGTNSLIIFFDNMVNTGKLKWRYIDELNREKVKSYLKKDILLEEKSLYKEFDFKDLKGKRWRLIDEELEQIKIDITSKSNVVGLDNTDFFEVRGGFQPPIDKIENFEVKEEELFGLNDSEKEYCYKVVFHASDITRYAIENSYKKYWIVLNDYDNENIVKQKFPNLYRKISGKIELKNGKWWHFPNIRNFDLIKNNDIKILSPRTAESNSFALDDNKLIFKGTNAMIISKKINPYYVIGILNSSLGNFWYSNFGYDYHGGKSKKYEPGKTKKYSIPILNPTSKEDKIVSKIISKNVKKIIDLIKKKNEIIKVFKTVLKNQTINNLDYCKFGKYFDKYESYEFSRETFNKINQIKAKITRFFVEEINNKIVIYVSFIDEESNEIIEKIKAVEITVDNEILRKFLYFSFRDVNENKKNNVFGKGIILDKIREVYIPYFVVNSETNSEKIENLMNEFNSKTEELWKNYDGENFNTYTEIEDELNKKDKEIDSLVFEIYNIRDKYQNIIKMT